MSPPSHVPPIAGGAPQERTLLAGSRAAWIRHLSQSVHLADISIVFVWTTAANVLLFLFLALVARSLNPAQYGLFAALMGVVVLLGFGFLAVQTSAATAVAGLPRGDAARVARRGARRMVWGAALLLLTLCLLSPLADRFLHAGGLAAPICAALFAAVLVPWSAMLGLFQGMSRFSAFGGLTLLQACTRLLAAATLLFTRDVGVLFAAAAISVLPAMAVGVRLIGPWNRGASLQPEAAGNAVPALSLRPFLLALLTAIAVGFPTVGDVILVRHVYSPRAAGLFAGAALVARVVLFLPVAVNAVLYPRYLALVDIRQRVQLFRRGLLVTALVGCLAVAVLSVSPHATLRILVGAGYEGGAGLIPIYATAAFAFSAAAVYAFLHLSIPSVRYVAGVLLPHLLLLVIAPFVLSHSLVALALGILLIGISLVAWSEVATRMLVHARVTRRAGDYGAG